VYQKAPDIEFQLKNRNASSLFSSPVWRCKVLDPLDLQ